MAQLACSNCSASLKYESGTTKLICPYCGSENEIINQQSDIKEVDYKSFISQKIKLEDTLEIITTKCSSCSAEVTLKPNLTSDECPFCGTSIIVNYTQSKKIIKPAYLLNFKINKKEAQDFFKVWIGTLWFAPNKLKSYARSEEGFNGIYMPFWTYDCQTQSRYQGQRGDNYYVTETYNDTDQNGNTVTRTRQVIKTRWTSVSGYVNNSFDDVLVIASNSLPIEYSQNLEPWDLNNLVDYKQEYLSGFRTESYQITVDKGFETAKEFIEDDINISIQNDIGGDQQTINNVQTSYDNISFKHILLPVWISAYRFQDKVYRIMVNARTGEVTGERPYSKIKIALAIIFGLILILILLYLIYNH